MRTLKIRTLIIAAIVSFCCAFTCMAFAPTVKADGSYFKMENGASYRIGGSNGIRFRAEFSDDVKANIEAADEYGFLVFPQQFLVDSEGKTITGNYIDKVEKYQQVVSDKESYQKDGVNYLNCAITNILEGNRGLDFTAVCYYKTGETYTYADLDPDFSRNLTQLLSKGYLNVNGTDKTANRADIAETYDWFSGYDYPVQISSEAELASVSAEVTNGNTFDKVNFKLTDDITLDNSYQPIATTFAGYINANEKTVTSKYGIELAETSGTVTNLGARKSIPESTDESTSAWMKTNNVSQYGVKTIGENNTFVMYKSDMYISSSCTVKHGNPYIAFNGNYGAGTFISLDFVGKAMPYVSFFNKKVTDSMIDGEEGILLVNGVTGLNSSNAQASSIQTNYTVMAPKKAESGNFWDSERTTLEGSSTADSLFSANGLVEGTNYRLVLGITNCATGTGANAKFTVNAMLINVDTNRYVHKIVTDCTLSGKTTQTIGSDYFSGSIVIYGSTFGETTVKINSVDENGSFGLYALQNLSVAADTQEWITKNSVKYYNAESIATGGTITLAQNQYLLANKTNIDAPYLAIDKNINFVDTAVSIDFTGKNMPFIGLAQGNLTSSWTNGTKGMLIANGFYDYNSTSETDRYTDRTQLFKMCNLPSTGSFWDNTSVGNRIEMNYGTTKVGVEGLDENTNYRFILFIEKNELYGWQLYYRLYSLKDSGGLNQVVLTGNVKIGDLSDYSDDTFTGKLVFWSATHYQAKFKINGIYTNCSTSDLYSNIALKSESGEVKNTLFN